jgi:hypothetical protein
MNAPAVKPAMDRPHGLWSLWDMLDKHAFLFASTTSALAEFKCLCSHLERDDPQGDAPEKVLQIARQQLQILRRAYILSGMQDKMGAMERLDRSINSPPGYHLRNVANLNQEMRHFFLGLRDLLSNEFYFHVNGEDVPLLQEQELFGEAVTKKFPRAIEDVSESAKCLALQRTTASVFHLMRVMEIGAQTLGRKLKVAISVKDETWHQIILHVNGKVEKPPSRTPKEKKRKSKLAGAAAHLQSVRLAWRNEVMHPKHMKYSMPQRCLWLISRSLFNVNGRRAHDFIECSIKCLAIFIDANFARHIDEALGLLWVVLLVCFSCGHDARLSVFGTSGNLRHVSALSELGH